VRGSQSALFGRNTLGGLINISSGRPSVTKWRGEAEVPFGNFSSFDLRASAAGPLGRKFALGLAFGHAQRDGFTVNDITGHDLDSRDATFGKAQLLWTPTSRWETRLIVSGERARDGDYALGDLAALRANPYHVARDFEGHTNRDLTSTTILARHEGSHLSFSSTTGFVSWKTNDLTDLDYTPLPLVTRSNGEKDFQFTQEVRVASAPAAPIKLSDNSTLKWQGGVFLFTQNYDQSAVNSFAPFLLSPLLSFSVDQHSPEAALDDGGIGVYGQGTVTFGNRIDAMVGARVDYENKKANLNTFYAPPIFPGTIVDAEKSFSNVSPQFAFSYHVTPRAMTYVTLGRGFKAGGFNPASPPGSDAYDEEHTWHIEGGVKSQWAGRVTANVAVFSIDWSDLQLNVPNPFVPGQFYIANVGSARSSGIEVEVNAHARDGVDGFASLGYTHARFGDNSFSSGVDVSGKTIPNTPDYTAILGTELSHPLRSDLRVYGRAEAVFYGQLWYDEANTQGQDAYPLANFRGGVRARYVFVEAWVKNAFDRFYIPVAFAYGPFAPSGFVGESGRPRTFGLRAGVSF
jgi:iron complex outermembrane receptor protein